LDGNSLILDSSSDLFVTTRNREAAAFVLNRLVSLKELGASDNPSHENFSTEYALLKRISQFPFSTYPDYAIPSRLVQWPHMRWDHVYDVVQIIESLRHVKGALSGTRIKLEPFQILILLCILGPEDPETGLRIIKEGLLTMSRKCAKTTIIAAIVLALMVLDKSNYGLEGQELYVGASDRKQAGITFSIVSKFIVQDRELGISRMFKIVPSSKHMTHVTTLTEFEVLSSDAYRSHGLNPTVVVFDEVGNVPAGAAAEFIDVLTSGFGAQNEPLTLMMSTQAPSDVHVFSQIVDRCKRINCGEEEGLDIAGFVFETPEQLGKEKLDIHDERYWYLSNPGLGTIVSLEDMRKASRDAKALPGKEAKFRNLRLNQRANPYNPLISKSAWIKCGGEIDYQALYGKKCYLALDLSGVLDLTSLVATFEPDDDGLTLALPYFFLPGAGIEERQDEDKVPYVMWAQQGYIDITSDRTISHALIAGQIEVCLENYDVQGIGCDRWRIEDTKAALRERGLGAIADDKAFLFPIGQGFKDASLCVDALERIVAEEKLRHGDHPVLTWCVSNTVTEADPAGNRKFSKVKSYGRIDGTVALAMSLRVRELLTHGEQEEESAFESSDCYM
jgi:phage terminase large subunit-like protein